MNYLDAHEQLCNHWQRVLGDDMLSLAYEDLVTSPESATSRLFAHVGLERPENWTEFYRGDSPVATASIAQVREPLSQSSIGSWRRYEKHLAPVYQQWGAATPSGEHGDERAS